MVNNKGWECPKCSNVYSPFVSECKYCNKNETLPISINTYEFRGLQIPNDECAIAAYFKAHPNESAVNLYCSCSRCSSWCGVSGTTTIKLT